MRRRSFLGTILALGAAPAIVRATSLMPTRVVPMIFDGPKWIFVQGDGVGTPCFPYDSWLTAAPTLDVAISAALAGDSIYVRNSLVYAPDLGLPGLKPLESVVVEGCELRGGYIGSAALRTVVRNCAVRTFDLEPITIEGYNQRPKEGE